MQYMRTLVGITGMRMGRKGWEEREEMQHFRSQKG